MKNLFEIRKKSDLIENEFIKKEINLNIKNTLIIDGL
jgi:hypothetical protein